MPGRAVQAAQTWVNACAPAPIQRSVLASGRASNSVAFPETAPVRSAVRKVPSRIASGWPVSASSSATIARIVGRPRAAFVG